MGVYIDETGAYESSISPDNLLRALFWNKGLNVRDPVSGYSHVSLLD